ncbi:MAG: hypothetical protein QOJ76_1336, partial [Acidobacteriota bacterium]|nr:hypothetical protein [Acidobacteriota bacterium]
MSKRYDDRGFGRYGDADEERNDERTDERYTDRGYGDYAARDYGARDYGRAADHTPPRGYAAGRGGGVSERDYGSEHGAREYGPREYDSRDYAARPGREGILGGYAGSTPRRRESEDYGRDDETREYGRDYGRDYERGRGPVRRP